MHEDTIAGLVRRIEELERAEARRAGQDPASPAGDPETPVNRRGFLTKAGAVAVGAGAASLASVLTAAPASAAAGGPVVMGAVNDAGSAQTDLASSYPATTLYVTNSYNLATSSAIAGFCNFGVGVDGSSINGTGVRAQSSTGIGVDAFTTGAQGIGVKGQTAGIGSGVYGVATANGVAMFGDATTNGTGVQARSTSGTALNVLGTARFSRSGTATIAGTSGAPKSSIVVPSVALTAKSLVLVTEQKNVAGAWVRAAVPNVAGSSFTIYLNKTVTTSFPLAWMVIEKP